MSEITVDKYEVDGNTVRMIWTGLEPLFPVEDIVTLGKIDDPVMALEEAKKANSTILLRITLSDPSFESRPHQFINHEGAKSMAKVSTEHSILKEDMYMIPFLNYLVEKDHFAKGFYFN